MGEKNFACLVPLLMFFGTLSISVTDEAIRDTRITLFDGVSDAFHNVESMEIPLKLSNNSIKSTQYILFHQFARGTW